MPSTFLYEPTRHVVAPDTSTRDAQRRFEVADGRGSRCGGPPGQEGNEAGHPVACRRDRSAGRRRRGRGHRCRRQKPSACCTAARRTSSACSSRSSGTRVCWRRRGPAPTTPGLARGNGVVRVMSQAVGLCAVGEVVMRNTGTCEATRSKSWGLAWRSIGMWGRAPGATAKYRRKIAGRCSTGTSSSRTLSRRPWHNTARPPAARTLRTQFVCCRAWPRGSARLRGRRSPPGTR